MVARAKVQSTLGRDEAARRDAREARTHADAALALAGERPHARMFIHNLCFIAALLLGDTAALAQCCHAHAALSEALQLPHYRQVSRLMQAQCRLAEGDATAALRALDETDIAVLRGNRAALHWLLETRWLALQGAGRHAEACAAAQALLDFERLHHHGNAVGPLIALLREVELQVARAEAERQRARAAEAEQRALHDALTGLHNRRALDAQLATALPAERPHAVLLLDIDHFKAINDRHGHGTGDAVLRELAGVLRATSPAAATVARQGGDEFVVFVPDLEHGGALALAERLCERARRHPGWPAPLGPGAVTLSVGVAIAHAGDDGPALLRRADAALYRAKHEGRDRATRPTPALGA